MPLAVQGLYAAMRIDSGKDGSAFAMSYHKTSCAGSRAICPAPVRRTLQPSSSPYTLFACGAQRALRHEYS